ncbi:transposase [endosymbiont of Ridgeia piscesae]|uniref:transposase n=1 Tax=endosymbiont of Ridgeia piscesae TaxID=54398 RepID=UPI0012F748FD|nr:transposase [endosymbiont of Ridgeia piscesae]
MQHIIQFLTWSCRDKVPPHQLPCNGLAEGNNRRIKVVRVRSRGFHNKQHFATPTYFHLGGLNRYPEGVEL